MHGRFWLLGLSMALPLAGCAPTSSCSFPGGSSCDMQTNLIDECHGPDQGGDEDGDIVAGTDCTAEGLECRDNVYHEPVIAFCAGATCSLLNACDEPGASWCSLDIIWVCTTSPTEPDCNEWEVYTDCTDTDDTCEQDTPATVCN